MFHVKQVARLADNDRSLLQRALERIARPGSRATAEAGTTLSAYASLIRKWNTRTQLVSHGDLPELESRHIAESLALAAVYPMLSSTLLLDLGSGAGLPGIPLAIAFPDLRVTLLEPKRRRVLFLSHAKRELGLENVEIVPHRAEDGVLKTGQRFDLVTARAVAQLDVLWTYARPLLNEGGVLLAPKGGNLDAEIAAALKKTPGSRVDTRRYPDDLVPHKKDRKLVIMQMDAG